MLYSDTLYKIYEFIVVPLAFVYYIILVWIWLKKKFGIDYRNFYVDSMNDGGAVVVEKYIKSIRIMHFEFVLSKKYRYLATYPSMKEASTRAYNLNSNYALPLNQV